MALSVYEFKGSLGLKQILDNLDVDIHQISCEGNSTIFDDYKLSNGILYFYRNGLKTGYTLDLAGYAILLEDRLLVDFSVHADKHLKETVDNLCSCNVCKSERKPRRYAEPSSTDIDDDDIDIGLELLRAVKTELENLLDDYTS